MLHSGYEASAVHYTFSLKVYSLRRAPCCSRGIAIRKRRAQVAAEKPKSSLVQIDAIAPRPTLKGTEVAVGGKLADGIEQAFDYRGDVTVTLASGECIEGYIFDREKKADPAASTLRIMTKTGREDRYQIR